MQELLIFSLAAVGLVSWAALRIYAHDQRPYLMNWRELSTRMKLVLACYLVGGAVIVATMLRGVIAGSKYESALWLVGVAGASLAVISTMVFRPDLNVAAEKSVWATWSQQSVRNKISAICALIGYLALLAVATTALIENFIFPKT